MHYDYHKHVLSIHSAPAAQYLRKMMIQKSRKPKRFRFSHQEDRYDDNFDVLDLTLTEDEINIELSDSSDPHSEEFMLKTLFTSFYFARMDYHHYEPCLKKKGKLPTGISKETAATYREVYSTFMELKEHDEACTVRIWSDIHTEFFDGVYDTEDIAKFGDTFNYMQNYEREYRQLTYCCIEIYSLELTTIMEQFCNTNAKYNSQDACWLIESKHGKGAVSIGEGKVVYCVECNPELSEETLLSFAGDEVVQQLKDARFYMVHTYLWSPR